MQTKNLILHLNQIDELIGEDLILEARASLWELIKLLERSEEEEDA